MNFYLQITRELMRESFSLKRFSSYLNEEGMIECHPFCNPYEIMDPDNALQWLLTLQKRDHQTLCGF